MGSSETLRSVIDVGGTTKRLDELSTARVIGKIAEQLHAAQQKAGAGKAIGPITPTAIMIESTGATTLGLAEPDALAYSAPEQTADRRSDVFSLGVVMWEALTHQRLFDAPDAATIRLAIQSREITPPSELNANIPAELGAICMKALARNATDRYQSAKVMAAEIEAVLEEAGYADNDEKIAEYMAGFRQPAAKPKITLPPLGVIVTPAIGVPPPPVAVVPNDTIPNAIVPEPQAASPKLPSILDQPPTQPPPMMTAASPGSLSPTKVLDPGGGAVATAPPKPAATILPEPEPSPSSTIPGAGPLATSLPTAISTPTVHGFAAAEAFAAMSAPPIDTKPEPTPKLEVPKPPKLPEALRLKLPDLPPGATKAESSVASAAAVDPTAPPFGGAAGRALGPTVAESRSNTPHPASVVALPAPGAKGRESQEVLGGWGWGTDSHAAIDQYEEPDEIGSGDRSRKTLFYVIGGGVGFALVVTIIAVGFGGSPKKKKEPPPAAAAMTEGSAVELAPQPPLPPSGSDTQPAIGSDTQAAGAGSAMSGSAMSGSAMSGSAMSGSAAGSAVATGSGTGSAVDVAIVTPDVPKPDVPKPDVPKPDVPKPDVPKPDVPKPDKTAVVPAKPITPPTKIMPKPDKLAVAPAKKPEKRPDPAPAKIADAKPNADAAYKTGLQQFMRGDTAGALASLRTSLAGNPNHAPTWRGLGLVFEKMGEKDQARAAFKRYLQLAPSAGDAEQIRNRLERLGS